MKKFKSVIIEDDKMASKSLEITLKKIKEIELIQSFDNPKEALKFIHENKQDLLFLDVEMPGMTGLELLEQLNYSPQVVMTTSNKDYAYDAFEFGITDFLIKPITLPRVEAAVAKVQERDEILNSKIQESHSNEIYLKVDGRYVRIPISELMYFENVGDYIKAITERGNFVIHGTLKSLDSRLKHPRLLKVHRSFIVNLGKIADIDDTGIIMENKKLIPVSRAHKPILIKTINII